MKILIEEEKKRLEAKANRKFDSSKNWSIMIDQENNEMRNNIMRKFKFRQLKKNLHDFIRKERDKIIKARPESELGDETTVGSKPSTAATANTNTDKAPKLRGMP